jgi:hypothetical protein
MTEDGKPRTLSFVQVMGERQACPTPRHEASAEGPCGIPWISLFFFVENDAVVCLLSINRRPAAISLPCSDET